MQLAAKPKELIDFIAIDDKDELQAWENKPWLWTSYAQFRKYYLPIDYLIQLYRYTDGLTGEFWQALSYKARVDPPAFKSTAEEYKCFTYPRLVQLPEEQLSQM